MNIYAHRGFSGYYPENTMLAFEKCLNLKIYGVEFDVHKCKDNQLVVIHDETVERMYNGSGYVKDLTLHELKSLTCKDLTFSNHPKCIIPTFDEVLNIFSSSNIILNIELKTDIFEYNLIEKDVISLIKKYNIEDRVIISSFNHNSIKRCRDIDENIKTALLYHFNNDNIVETAKHLKSVAIHPYLQLIDKSVISKAKKNNLDLNTYTVNSIDDMKKCIDLKVDGAFTNFPNIFIDLLENYTF